MEAVDRAADRTGTPPARAPERRRLSAPAWAGLYVIGASAVVTLLHVWRGDSYWNFSEGVYLATARLVMDGASLYTEVVAAQPPPLFYIGAGLLAISDTLLFVRGALGVTTALTGGLVAVVVGRLTGRPGVAVIAGLVALLTPWTIREHATLTPDPLAAAPLLAAALLAARPGSRASAAAGGLAALAASLKLSFLLPAAAVVVAARRRGAYLAGALLAAGALTAASVAAWGFPALWENVVAAQREAGINPRLLLGNLAQTGWNLGPLLALCGLAYLARARARDPALFRSMLALVLGSVAVVVTFAKDGTYVNTLAAIEPSAVALAATGLVWLLEDRTVLAGRRRLATVGAALACLFVALQSASLLALSERPKPFGNPFLTRGPGHELSEEQVAAAVATARACPPGAHYSGSPFIALLADRSLPGGQPDRFILGQAATHADVLTEVRNDGPLCPYRSLGGLPEGIDTATPVK